MDPNHSVCGSEASLRSRSTRVYSLRARCWFAEDLFFLAAGRAGEERGWPFMGPALKQLWNAEDAEDRRGNQGHSFHCRPLRPLRFKNVFDLSQHRSLHGASPPTPQLQKKPLAKEPSPHPEQSGLTRKDPGNPWSKLLPTGATIPKFRDEPKKIRKARSERARGTDSSGSRHLRRSGTPGTSTPRTRETVPAVRVAEISRVPYDHLCVVTLAASRTAAQKRDGSPSARLSAIAEMTVRSSPSSFRRRHARRAL